MWDQNEKTASRLLSLTSDQYRKKLVKLNSINIGKYEFNFWYTYLKKLKINEKNIT